MTEPAHPMILADLGGLAVAQEGDRVIVVDRRTGGLSVAVFVFGLLAVILIVFGVVAFFTAPLLGAVFVAVGLGFGVATWLLVNKFRARRALPLRSCRTVAVLDFRRGLFSAAGGALQGLNTVRFERKMQVGSSSPKLVAITPAGTTVLKRGNPFDGGIGTVDQVLNNAVAGATAPRG